MRLVVTLEQRFDQTPDGTVWTWSDFSYAFWRRYLEVFDAVRVVARVRAVQSVPSDYKRSDGDQAEFYPVPNYQGPLQFLVVLPQVMRSVRSSVAKNDAVIMRISSVLADLLEPHLSQEGHPYGVEVVGDPYDLFAPGAIRNPLRPLLRSWFTHAQKKQCARACGAAYVTQSSLQHRYPCKTFMLGVSDVELDNSAPPHCLRTNGRRTRLIMVGTLEQLYKSPDILIKAVAECVRQGHDLELTFVGDGRQRGDLETMAQREGIADRVLFRGTLPSGEAVRNELDNAHLFVLPSRQEGLPRAMVEAMSRGLPCIGSTVGGIPELLPGEDLVVPGDVVGLAKKISEVVSQPLRMAAMSERNKKKSREFRGDVLQRRRIEFYRYVRKCTEDWLSTQCVS